MSRACWSGCSRGRVREPAVKVGCSEIVGSSEWHGFKLDLEAQRAGFNLPYEAI